MIPAMLIVFLAATGCQAQEDASKTLGPVVQAYADVWNSGDTQKLDAIVDAEFVRHASPTSQTSAENLDSLKKVITNFREMYPDFNVVLEEGVYAGNTAAVRWTFTATNSGAMNPALSGKEVKLSGISFFHVANGKITEEWIFSDNMDIMMQLGFKVVPPAAEGEE
jgi:steroid delta-isomerase-like uncharacterized protein